jgi:hypothetical protein
MSDLLKEAIADAKAVRETALANAKMALEEAFTPQLKSMLSAKLKEDETEDDVVVAPEEDEEVADEVPAEEGYYEDEEIPAEEDEEIPTEVPAEEDEEIPVAAAEEDEEIPVEVPAEEDEDNLDLEAVIKELEAELSDDEDDAVAENAEDADNAYEEDAENNEDPNHTGGTIGEGEGDETEEDDDVEVDESIFNEEDFGNGNPDEKDNAYDEDGEADIEEELDKTSGIGTGTGSGDTDKSSEVGKGGQEDAKKLGEQLKEYKEAVRFLKDKLHEVNILNAKLLFTNKLFKSYSLNNNQKLKVVETFDRAQTTREIKLVYSTLAEQFGDNTTIARKKSITESASSAVKSTRPSKASRKVITEEAQVANRFKKLAGIIK